jgi:hypothetical protein
MYRRIDEKREDLETGTVLGRGGEEEMVGEGVVKTRQVVCARSGDRKGEEGERIW